MVLYILCFICILQSEKEGSEKGCEDVEEGSECEMGKKVDGKFQGE